MSNNEKVIDQLSNFIMMYVLIFGAIFVILGVQFIIIGLLFFQFEAVCVSFPLIGFGGILVWLMLQDKVYHRVFYRPAYQDYYSQAAQTPQTPAQAYPPGAGHPASGRYGAGYPYHRRSHYAPPQQSPYSPYPAQQQSPYSQQPQYGYPAQQHPSPYPAQQQTSYPQQQTSYPTHSQESYQQAPRQQEPYRSPQVPDGTTPPSGHADAPSLSHSDAPPSPHSDTPPLSHPESPSPESSSLEDRSSEDPYADPEMSVPPPLPDDVSDAVDLQQAPPDPDLAVTDALSPGHDPADQSAPIPYAQYPPPQPAYYSPYYPGYGQPYGGQYYSMPYVAYVQYFRETFSIPHIRSLLIIFLISIVGGSLVLIVGEPVIYLFPIFFIIAFAFPSFIWISYVYHKDILEPESKHGIFIALTWGMFSTLFAIFPNTFMLIFFDLYYPATLAMILTAVVVAPINEEFFKPLGLRRVRGEINSELDGLIYGVTCGMGFAIIENFTYELTFLFSDDSPIVIWTIGSFIRGIGSTIVHAVGAGLIGFTYARIKLSKRDGPKAADRGRLSLYGLPLGLAYLIAVLLHAAWNGSASIPELWSTDLGVITSIAGHIITFALSFHIIKSLADEGIRRDIERHQGAQYQNPVEPPPGHQG